ncbi:OB-fold nucleic acid binding domain-containing protein [Rhodosalinus sp.]|uniref:OB-fold nucleic acid binding domain-containing protein n=1 Tax=Rhodosalinus sp. TaxID=2047741 RepID=UPI003569EB2B
MHAESPAPRRHWPRPPAAVPAEALTLPPTGARVTVAGLVILRQRPGTAKGVIFLTLEDETGVVNVVVWRALYERFRRAVIAARMLRVTGKLQREAGVTHVIAERIEDISEMLDALLEFDTCRAADQPESTAHDPRAPGSPGGGLFADRRGS